MKVSVDSDVCAGHGACVDICPEVFEIGAEGYSVVIVDDVAPELVARVERAVEECPTGAIEVDRTRA